MISSRSLTITLGVSLCGVAGYLLYQLLRRDDEDDAFNLPLCKFKVIEIKVPSDCVKAIIGRGGSKIKQLESQTNTKIKFNECSDKTMDRVCIIKGTTEGCIMADHLINEIIYQQPKMECETVWVPQQAVGKLIGRCGENITSITNVTGAQIKVSDGDWKASSRKITIRGTKDQITLTKSYIEESVAKFQASKQSIEASLMKREPRGPSKAYNSAKTPLESPTVEKIISGQSESPFEVYVSAMIDPSRFWVQIVGPKAKELDLLVEEMTEYYRNEENREMHVLESVQVGDLVAATFQYDNKWYRAEILHLDEEDDQVELYYVDYGDTDTVATNDLYELRTDYLQLHFQAIECFLARIEPNGSRWAEEAVDKFEEWTHVAQWQKLSAKINGYSVRDKTRAKREGSPVPGVDLFDVVNQEDVDIADELVKHGYAVYKKESARTSRATSVSNISVDSSSQ